MQFILVSCEQKGVVLSLLSWQRDSHTEVYELQHSRVRPSYVGGVIEIRSR